jgi:hypothetical protein
MARQDDDLTIITGGGLVEQRQSSSQAQAEIYVKYSENNNKIDIKSTQ